MITPGRPHKGTPGLQIGKDFDPPAGAPLNAGQPLLLQRHGRVAKRKSAALSQSGTSGMPTTGRIGHTLCSKSAEKKIEATGKSPLGAWKIQSPRFYRRNASEIDRAYRSSIL